MIEMAHAPAAATPAGARLPMQAWAEWQLEVVAILRRDFREILHHVSIEDIDWPAWLHFYLEGRTPGSAVARALERDL